MKRRLAIRWKITWFLTVISVVRSMDAVNFAVAAKRIMPEYGISNVRMGLLYTIYTFGYALFHLPGGVLSDKLGPRKMLFYALLWWSIFTGLTAHAPEISGLAILGPFYAFLIVRFLIGLGEGVCYPGSSRMVASWMASDERATASGLVFSGLGIGYGIAPPIVAYVMVHYGWRPAFYGFTIAGVLVAFWWYGYVRDRPEDHPAISAAELQRIRGNSQSQVEPAKLATPWRLILTSRNVWLLGAIGFCLDYGAFLFQSWFYLYLVNERGFREVSGGFFTSMPFLAIAVMTPLGGMVSDAMVRRFGRTTGRRLGGVTLLFLSASCLAYGGWTGSAYAAVAFLALGDGLLNAGFAPVIGSIVDISGSHAGASYGFCFTITQIGGIIAPTLTPILADRFGWGVAIYVMALLAVVASLLWLGVDAAKELTAEAEPAYGQAQVSPVKGQ